MEKKQNKVSVRKLAMAGMLSAVAFILMYLELPIPIMPSFIKFDFSDLPALIGAFALGPLWGVVIELVKNLLHLAVSQSMFIGELSNFILGAIFVGVAGFVYKHKKTRIGALIGSVAGAFIMSVVSIATNYFITYPFYTNFMPMEGIIGAYQAILPVADSLLKCLIIFNVPFNFVKGMVVAVICFIIYKKLSPILKPKK